MEALRTIIDSARLASIIDLPESLREGEVEVIVQSVPKPILEPNRKAKLAELCGSLNEYADSALRELEKKTPGNGPPPRSI